jgi:hypothetical protein
LAFPDLTPPSSLLKFPNYHYQIASVNLQALPS